MRSSRGMGAVNPDKMPKGRLKQRRDNTDFTENGQVRPRRDNTDFTVYAEGGEVWNKPRPKGLGTPQKLSPAKKSAAKAAARRAGRPYPNLIDNMRAAK